MSSSGCRRRPSSFRRPLLARLEAGRTRFLVAAARAMPDYRRAADASCRRPFRHAHGEARPTFVQVDFGLLQWRRTGSRPGWSSCRRSRRSTDFRCCWPRQRSAHYGFDDLTPLRARHLARGVHPARRRHDHRRSRSRPRSCCSRSIRANQKTWPDFAMTEQMWGVRAVDLREIERHGSRLFINRDGKLTPIARIYNRVIPDELEKKGMTLAVRCRRRPRRGMGRRAGLVLPDQQVLDPVAAAPVGAAHALSLRPHRAAGAARRVAAEAAVLVRRRRHHLRARPTNRSPRSRATSGATTSCRSGSRSRRSSTRRTA